MGPTAHRKNCKIKENNAARDNGAKGVDTLGTVQRGRKTTMQTLQVSPEFRGSAAPSRRGAAVLRPARDCARRAGAAPGPPSCAARRRPRRCLPPPMLIKHRFKLEKNIITARSWPFPLVNEFNITYLILIPRVETDISSTLTAAIKMPGRRGRKRPGRRIRRAISDESTMSPRKNRGAHRPS